MSIPSSVLQFIGDNLKNRQLLTFTLTTFNSVVYPICCLFNNGTNEFGCLPPNQFIQTNANANTLIVYNPVTMYLETLDSTYTVIPGSFGATDNGRPFLLVPSNEVQMSPMNQFVIQNGKLYNQNYRNLFLTMYYVPTNQTEGFLGFCSQTDPDLSFCQIQNITLLNALSVSLIASVQDKNTSCCFSDTGSIVNAIFSWDKPWGQTQTNYLVFPSQLACQQADQKCVCPSNNLCWMYNNTNVPCCIQGNPSDPRFSNDAAALITQDKNECVSKALKCSQWRFNTVDVPCCIQRTPEQWTYDTATMQSFDQYSDCVAASRDTCTFNALLQQPTNLKDYYNLILESNFTSGCEPLRTVNPFGTSADCSKDPDPVACQYGNCTQNSCDLWSSSSTNPYMFTQSVRCLPPVQCCSGSSKQFICNAGKSNAYACCSSSGNTCCQ